MRPLSLIMPATAMVLALSAYAIGQSAPHRQPDTQEQPPAKQADPAADAKRTQDYYRQREAQVIEQLKLSPEQKREYDALQLKLKEETDKMMAASSGYAARGMEINKMLHDNLQQIFTKDQYARYGELWGRAGAGDVEAVQERKVIEQATDEQILREIGLSNEQWKGYYELMIEMEVPRAEFQELLSGDDANAVGLKGSEINRMVHAGMQALLTPEQYQQWLDKWAELMPKPTPDGLPVSPRRMILPGDQQRPIAGPADAEEKAKEKPDAKKHER